MFVLVLKNFALDTRSCACCLDTSELLRLHRVGVGGLDEFQVFPKQLKSHWPVNKSTGDLRVSPLVSFHGKQRKKFRGLENELLNRHPSMTEEYRH